MRFQPQPTLEAMEKWSTPRLLRYFKTHRMRGNFSYSMDANEEKLWNEHKTRMDAIRAILNKREHVK